VETPKNKLFLGGEKILCVFPEKEEEKHAPRFFPKIRPFWRRDIFPTINTWDIIGGGVIPQKKRETLVGVPPQRGE